MIFIGLGSSVGDAQEMFNTTEIFFKQQGIVVLKKSKNLINPPFGGVAQNEFTNAVWQLAFNETTWEKINWVLLPKRRRRYLKAKKLLKVLHQAEALAGRKRNRRWDDRTLDLDILMFCDLICTYKKLSLPHPEISKRIFVLKPWREIVDEDFSIPKFGKLKDLIKNLN